MVEANQHDELHSVFTSAELKFSEVDAADAQHSEAVQKQIRESIRQFMRVGSLIRESAVFSPNETLEEIDTGDLR